MSSESQLLRDLATAVDRVDQLHRFANGGFCNQKMEVRFEFFIGCATPYYETTRRAMRDVIEARFKELQQEAIQVAKRQADAARTALDQFYQQEQWDRDAGKTITVAQP